MLLFGLIWKPVSTSSPLPRVPFSRSGGAAGDRDAVELVDLPVAGWSDAVDDPGAVGADQEVGIDVGGRGQVPLILVEVPPPIGTL